MNLLLVGMSGVGKSTWAARLCAAGYERIDCDDLIAASLRAHSGAPIHTMDDMGGWLGLPHTPSYAAHERIFLDCEAAVLSGLLPSLQTTDRPLVIDAGGSAVYAGAALFAQIRALATVVYLSVSRHNHRSMLTTYLQRPRPVVWNGAFRPRPGEPVAQTYARCYPQLIRSRERLYQAYADLTLSSRMHRSRLASAEDFLRYVGALHA